MSTPDVRVRLSAEGVAEVVAALKQIQAEGQKTSQKSSRSFTGLNSVLGGTTRLLAGLGVAVGVGALTNFIRNSAQAADQVGKLGQKVGASVGNLSALSLAAATADVGTEQLTTGLIFLNRKLAELAKGSPQAQAAFRQLGLSAKDFQGKDAVEAFELVSQRMATLGDGARKTATAVDIFGRSGAQLIPLMNDLADEGLENVIKRARELGVLFDEEMVAATERMNDDFELLKMQAQGLGAQFATGFAPNMSQALQMITGDLGRTTEMWRLFGQILGWIVKNVVGPVATGIDVIVVGLMQTAGWIGAIGRMAADVVRGDFAGASEEFNKQLERDTERANALWERIKVRAQLSVETPPPPEPRERPDSDGGDPVELARRQSAATQSIRDAELSLLKAHLKARSDAEKRSYEEGATSLQASFAERRRLIAEEANAEVAQLLSRKAMLDTEEDQIRAQAEAKRIDVEVNRIRLEEESQLAALASEETRAARDLGAKSLAIERQLLEARGERHAAAMLAIDEEIRQADVLFLNQGMADEARLAVLEQIRASRVAQIDYDERQRQAQAAMADLGLERQRIEARMQAGLVSQLEGEQQILQLEIARVTTLEQAAAHLMAAAQATGDPEKIQQAREFAASIETLGIAASEADAAMERLRDGLRQSGIDALTDMFATGIREGRKFKDVMQEMALSVVQSMRRIAAEILATKIMGLILPGLSDGGKIEGGATGGLVRPGRISRFSAGGLLSGPGTGTSDSLVALTDGGKPVRLSSGEFVVRATSVAQPGALEFLRDFNFHSMSALRPTWTVPRFAEGGVIGAGPAAGAGGGDSSLRIGLDDGLLLKALETPSGQRVLVETIGRNRRTLQRLLER